jgi:hypothetical protein
MNKYIIEIVGGGLITTFIVGNIACTKQEQTQVIADITPVGACVADIIAATTGTEDPLVIASTCLTAVEDVYQVVSEMLASNTKIVTSADAGLAFNVNDAQRAHLLRIQARAFTLLHPVVPVATIIPQVGR